MAHRPVEAFIVALPETAGSALYGMVDMLSATGTLHRQLVGEESGPQLIRTKIASPALREFRCGNGVPVVPDVSLDDVPEADLIILPELWLAPDDDLSDRHDDVKAWIRQRYRSGCAVYSACSGAVLLAATGLLDGCEATSHWGYQDLFARRFPRVRFRPEPNLVFTGPGGRIVTAGGTTSWHDLAIHIIARYCGPEEALRIAKVYLLKWHAEGQLPFASLVRRQPHADAAVRRAEDWLARNFRRPHTVAAAVSELGVAERSLKRRFKAATGTSMIAYLQNLRMEEAKHLLESTALTAEEIAAVVGYENEAFFRRLFRRLTGLTPSQYRRMFEPIAKPIMDDTHIPDVNPGDNVGHGSG